MDSDSCSPKCLLYGKKLKTNTPSAGALEQVEGRVPLASVQANGALTEKSDLAVGNTRADALALQGRTLTFSPASFLLSTRESRHIRKATALPGCILASRKCILL